MCTFIVLIIINGTLTYPRTNTQLSAYHLKIPYINARTYARVYNLYIYIYIYIYNMYKFMTFSVMLKVINKKIKVLTSQ